MEQAPSNRIEDLVRERARLDAELESCRELATVLLVDIVDSTRFYNDHGDVAGLVMVQKCLELLVPPIEQHKGKVVKTIGDAILARFADATDAVQCAIEMQRNVAQRNDGRAPDDEIHVRVAINLGLALLTANDIFGDVVNVTARIESATKRDEIIISASVYEKIQHLGDIPVRKKASGVELKGKPGKLDLYSVGWRPEDTAGPALPRPSNEQLEIATGLHTNLMELAQQGGPGGPGSSDSGKGRGSGTRGVDKTMIFGSGGIAGGVDPGVSFEIVRVFPNGRLGTRHRLEHPGMIAGQQGEISITDDELVAPEHARFTQLGDGVYVEDLGSAQGVYFRLREAYRLKDGDTVQIGGQKFRFVAGVSGSPAGLSVSSNGTVVMPGPSTSTAAPASLLRLDSNGQETDRYTLPAGETSFGRSKGTYTFPEDLYMSTAHARIALQGDHYFLTDLGSTNGTFARVRKCALIHDGDTVLVGRQLLRILAISTT
jgi:class 3 adenylate cyclase/pSer/pThr/pTyr-binding forkhead associated (FHA) protein